MTGFVLALSTFVAAHVIPTRQGVRAALVALLGERGYLLAYSAVSLLLLAWVLLAASRAPYVELWSTAAWMRWVAVLVMPISLTFMVTGALSPNPLSVTFRRHGFRAESPGIVAVTRHPILWGFALWSSVHFFVNGDLVSVILFAGLTLFALAGMIRIDRKRCATFGEATWRAQVSATSRLPFAAILAGRTGFPRDRRTAFGTLLALLIYAALLLHGHLALFSADPLAGLG